MTLEAAEQILDANQLMRTSLTPPPYHENATNGESIIMSTTTTTSQIRYPHSTTRAGYPKQTNCAPSSTGHYPPTPPPPYHPQPVVYVYPKHNYNPRTLQRRRRVNRWLYIILAACLASLLLALVKFILIMQNKAMFSQ